MMEPLMDVQVQITIDQFDRVSTLVSLWTSYTEPEFQQLRIDLAGEVGNSNGAVSILVPGDRELIVPSRTIRTLSISTRPVPGTAL